jgi:hypothetical protein
MNMCIWYKKGLQHLYLISLVSAFISPRDMEWDRKDSPCVRYDAKKNWIWIHTDETKTHTDLSRWTLRILGVAASLSSTAFSRSSDHIDISIRVGRPRVARTDARGGQAGSLQALSSTPWPSSWWSSRLPCMPTSSRYEWWMDPHPTVHLISCVTI